VYPAMAMNKEDPKPHILVVEDARDIREPLARYLREHGYRATTAADGAVARKTMKSSAIDLVVLDIMMPGEDGLSLCRHIRQTSQIPVILLTARGEEVHRSSDSQNQCPAAASAAANGISHSLRGLDP
jgi:two-component system OmpR family response regulator